jgi:hypothetical protein
MTFPPVSPQPPIPVSQQGRHGTWPRMLAYSASESVIRGPFFHPSREQDNEAGSIGVVQTHLSGGCVKRPDRLLNIAEGILEGAGLALMASEDLLCRADHLLASLQNKDGAYEQHKDEKFLRVSERVNHT